MEEKCEKVVPEEVLLGIANFLDLVPCKIPEDVVKEDVLKKKKEEEKPVTEFSLL